MKRILRVTAALMLLCAPWLMASKALSNDSASDKAPEGASGGPPAMPVMVIEVTPSEATFYQNYPGRVHAFRTAEVRARVDGIVQSRDFVEGSQVQSDDTLFTIDDRVLKANVRTAKADLDNALATHELSRQTLKRYSKLLKSGSISRHEYDTYNAQTKQTAAGVEQARARLESTQINLDYSRVTAPISGRIGRAMVTEGALVSANASTQLAKIEQIDKVYIDFTRASSEMARYPESFQPGNAANGVKREVEILLGDRALPQKGRLEFSAMEVDVSTGAITLRAVVDNPSRNLLPGMFVRVKMPIDAARDVLKVPQKAVQIGPGGPEVYTVENGQLKALPVVLGKMAGTDWVIQSGLKAGVQVVVSDITMIKAMRAPVVAMPLDGAATAAE